MEQAGFSADSSTLLWKVLCDISEGEARSSCPFGVYVMDADKTFLDDEGATRYNNKED